MTGGPRWLDDRERGDANISAVLLWPAVLVVVWLALQAGLYFFGRQAALGAAEMGASAARVYPVSAERGRSTSTRFVAEAAGSLVTDPLVEVEIAATSVRVRVTGTAVSLLPGLVLTVAQESVQPLEGLVP